VDTVTNTLDGIQEELLQTALQLRENKTHTISSYQEMKAMIAEGGFFLAPWKDSIENEAAIKQDCKATIRCFPMDNQDEANGKKCFYSGNKADKMALFARAY
jgi:prolyl-tRNA synthetase